MVASFRPGRSEALGADYATLSEGNPGLVYCSITGFGPRGPYAGYPGYEGVVAAKSGRMQALRRRAETRGARLRSRADGGRTRRRSQR